MDRIYTAHYSSTPHSHWWCCPLGGRLTKEWQPIGAKRPLWSPPDTPSYSCRAMKCFAQGHNQSLKLSEIWTANPWVTGYWTHSTIWAAGCLINVMFHMWILFFSETMSCKNDDSRLYIHQVPICLNIKEKIKILVYKDLRRSYVLSSSSSVASVGEFSQLTIQQLSS